jgi:hypothetical protein
MALPTVSICCGTAPLQPKKIKSKTKPKTGPGMNDTKNLLTNSPAAWNNNN